MRVTIAAVAFALVVAVAVTMIAVAVVTVAFLVLWFGGFNGLDVHRDVTFLDWGYGSRCSRGRGALCVAACLSARSLTRYSSICVAEVICTLFLRRS